jgi:hypothetical protein
MIRLVGGYYDDREFKGEGFEGKTPWSLKTLNIYNVEEALKLGFCSSVDEYYENNKLEEDKEWDELTEQEKAKIIEDYTSDDEIAGLEIFEDEKKALEYYESHLEECQEIENDIKTGRIIYMGTKQDREGFYVETYTLKEE